jgi:putative hydrolase of the HAD superfamily
MQATGPCSGGDFLAIRALFWDVGGVLLTNAWDHNERAEALEHFQVDAKEFQKRHETIVAGFERGKVTLDEYLDQTVFYQARTFTREEFREYMFSLSKPLPEVLSFAKALGASGKYFMGTINNESRELNQSRIEKFGLREIFRVFVSSCYVGLQKPQTEIYKLALDLTQFRAEECCFIDDRAANLGGAASVGMNTVQMQNFEQFQSDLKKLGVDA